MNGTTENVLFLDHNDQGVDIVVGDLHGCYDELQLLLNHIKFDKTKDRLISVGDLIDRGKDSVKCLQLLDNSWFYSVRGNHESMMWDAVKSIDYHAEAIWMSNGGSWAAHLQEKTQSTTILQCLCDRYIAHMPYAIVVGKGTETRFNVIHAELYSPSHRPLSDADVDNWTLSDDERFNVLWGRTVIHYGKGAASFQYDMSPTFTGHTPGIGVRVASRQYYLDTGCVFAKRQGVNTDCGLTIADPINNRYWTLHPTDDNRIDTGMLPAL